MNTFNYPKFNPKNGNLTEKIKKIYIKYRLNNNNILNYNNIDSLIASNNVNDEIYFWQLYSILGEKNIKIIVEKFYEKIFNDKKNKFFRKHFISSGNLEYHINHQTNYWLDVMGGGPKYFGGLELLNYKHNLSNSIMTINGANLWIKYMLETLFDLKYHDLEDKRIFNSLKEFIYFK